MERLSEGSPQACSQFFHVDATLQELSFFLMKSIMPSIRNVLLNCVLKITYTVNSFLQKLLLDYHSKKMQVSPLNNFFVLLSEAKNI